MVKQNNMFLTILWLCLSYAQSTDCTACRNCTCPGQKICPLVVRNYDNICLNRIYSHVIHSSCHNQYDITTTFEIMSNDTLAYYNLYVFGDEENLRNYRSCKDFKAVYTRKFESCTPNTTITTNSTFILVIECMNADTCSVYYNYLASCNRRSDTSSGLGISGLVLCSVVLILCIAFAIILIITRYKYDGIRITYDLVISLSAMSVTAILNMVFWILFVIQNTNYSVGAAWTIFWIDKIVLLLTVLIHLYLLYQWVIVIHPNKTKLIATVFVITACLSVAVTLITMTLHQFNIQYGIMLTVFYGFSYGIDLVISLIFLVYGILIMKLSNNRIQNVKIITFIAIMIVFNLSRCVVAAYFWIKTFSQTPDRIKIAGLYNIAFPTYGMAMVFYVVVFIIPDTVPSIVVLFILMSSIQKSTKDNRLSEVLLSDLDDIPKQYSEY